jgi:hypothetical protein
MNMKKGILALISLITLTLSLPLQACQPASANNFEVLSLELNPDYKVIVNEKFTVIADISNNSENEAIFNVPVMVNGIADDRKSILLAPGKSQQVQFTLSKSNPGTYEIRIGDKSSSIKVEEYLPPVLKLSDLKVSMQQANPGEEIVATAIVSNTGGSPGNYIAELKINDVIEQADKVILPPGVNYNIAFKITKNDPGTYTVAIGELTTQFTVLEPIKTIQLTEPSATPYKRTSQRPSSCCGGGTTPTTTGGACP